MMDDDRFDEMLSELARSFNTPPEPPLDAMWAVIEDSHFNTSVPISATRGFTSRAPWLAAAAALVVGIGIGHYLPLGSKPANSGRASTIETSNRSASATDTSAVAD